MVDLYLVILYAFFYLMNSYGFGPTEQDYTLSLGVDKAYTGYIQAAQPFFGVIGQVYLNYCTRDNKYRKTTLRVNVIFILGNISYFLTEFPKSNNTQNKMSIAGVVLLVIGRGLMCIGGARLMSRKFLSLNIQGWAQT